MGGLVRGVVVGSAVLLAGAAAGGGWYLMSPPIRQDRRPASEAPLSEWTHWDSYDTARESEEVISRRQKLTEEWALSKKEKATDFERELMRAAFTAKCIAANDPRLAPRR
jgi:hypothetical protein